MLKTEFHFSLLRTGPLTFLILQKDLSAIYIYQDISQHQDEIPVSGIVWPEPLGQAENKGPCTPNTVFFTTKILQYFNHYY